MCITPNNDKTFCKNVFFIKESLFSIKESLFSIKWFLFDRNSRFKKFGMKNAVDIIWDLKKLGVFALDMEI